jgi:predicted GNAT family acetyltransferase
MSEEIKIEHQDRKHRFVLEVEGAEAELTYQRSGDVIIFDHTEVPPALQHRGLANQLAEAALGYAREQNLQVDPQCRFMAVYIERHKQYQDLLRKPTESHTPRPLAGGTR